MALKDQAGPFSTYELYMQNDVNTKGCTQWFYFKVTNYSRGKVRFRIMNFVFSVLFSINQHRCTSEE